MLVFIDTETSGLDSATNTLLSVGLVLVADKKIVDTLEVYIDPMTYTPRRIIEEGALKINGLTIEWLRDNGSQVAYATATLANWFEKWRGKERNTFVGWNVRFDVDFLKTVFNPHLTMNRRTMDLTSVDMFLHPNRKSYHLQHVLAEEDIVCDRPHNALSDAIATFELWKKWS